MTDYAKNKIIDLMLGMSDDEAQIAYEALKNRLAAGKERGRNNGKKILLVKTTN